MIALSSVSAMSGNCQENPFSHRNVRDIWSRFAMSGKCQRNLFPHTNVREIWSLFTMSGKCQETPVPHKNFQGNVREIGPFLQYPGNVREIHLLDANTLLSIPWLSCKYFLIQKSPVL